MFEFLPLLLGLQALGGVAGHTDETAVRHGGQRDFLEHRRAVAGAADGVALTRVFAEAPYTRSSMATVFSAHSWRDHQVLGTGDALGSHFTTLAELLQEHGWQTWAVSDNSNVARSAGSAQGFDEFVQTWSDVEARIGNRAKAGQVAGNFNTMIMLRVKELATAEMLPDQLPRVEVFTLMSVSGVDDSSDPRAGVDFKSRNEDRISVSEVPMLTPAELISLPKGQAFALLEGGQLWKIRMPLPATDTDMPALLKQIDNEMERTYITNDH